VRRSITLGGSGVTDSVTPGVSLMKRGPLGRLFAVLDHFFGAHVEPLACHHVVGVGVDEHEFTVVVDGVATPT